MKIVVAPTSFKECLPAEKVASAISRGIRKIFPPAQLKLIPLSDGGDGFLASLITLTGGHTFRKKVFGPLGRSKYLAHWGFLGQNCSREFRGKRTAVIEMAEAAGLRLLAPAGRNPLLTHTYGVGELIKAVLDKNAERIIIGLGGSATVDGGCGMACALGVKFLDRNGQSFIPTGGSLHQINRISINQSDPRLKKVEIIGACDVNNPLLGRMGAARVFGPQKGASYGEVKILENNLRHLAQIIRRDLRIDVSRLKGGGAAGGLAVGLIAFLNARLVPGAEMFFKIINLEKRLKGADLVITGEGQLDETSFYGKAPVRLAQIVKKYNRRIPVVAIAGKLAPPFWMNHPKEPDELSQKTGLAATSFNNISSKRAGLGRHYQKLSLAGIDACFSIVPPGLSKKESIKNAAKLIEKCSEKIIKQFQPGRALFRVPTTATIILASGSPRRRQLLKRIIKQFRVVAPRINESGFLRRIKTPVRLVQTLARLKARFVLQQTVAPPNGLIIAADTVVWAGRKIITKPKNKKDAFRILKQLTGTRHSVITGVCALEQSSGRSLTGYEETVIRMKKISDAEIKKLVNSRRNLDKAGGYALQESGDPYIRIIKGSKSNVVGLPLQLTRRLIKKSL